jgi:predicted MPP superfamily phosphohydrolase
MHSALSFVLFGILLLSVIGIGEYYLYRRVAGSIARSRLGRWSRGITLAIFVLGNILAVFFLMSQPVLSITPSSEILIFSLATLLLTLLIVAFLSVIRTLMKAAAFIAIKAARALGMHGTAPRSYHPARRSFLRRSTIIAAGTVFGSSIYGAIRKDDFDVTRIAVPIANLPQEFDGFSIALLSDIHSSIFMQRDDMEIYARAVNNLGADCIAVTGDFVNSHVDEVYPFAEAFSQLKAPAGVYGVLGNHDYYTRKVETVAKNVNDCGIRLLVNEHVVLERNGRRITLLGTDDVHGATDAGEAFKSALRGSDPANAVVAMCHRPYFFPLAAEQGIGLLLSGHTHGGQIVLARVGETIIAPARIASPYVAGIYSHGTSRMYVSRGIGTIGLPVRLNCPPEITKIVLKAA